VYIRLTEGFVCLMFFSSSSCSFQPEFSTDPQPITENRNMTCG
jgi:hypothetical protein